MLYRFVLVLLLMCVADSEGRVVNSFQECRNFFFEKKWPMLKTGLPTTYEHICQHTQEQDWFATLYMTEYRIPLFSAYRMDMFVYDNQYRKGSEWYIEPMLSNQYRGPDMVLEDTVYSKHQAISEDYRNTNYDIGLLHPSSYQRNIYLNKNPFSFRVPFSHTFKSISHLSSYTRAHGPTYTLTNAVPQDSYFFHEKWKAMEIKAKEIMQKQCNFKTDKRFFVTGVIPSDMFIPFPEHDDEGDQQREYYRVNVPYAMWTAACCDAGTDAESFSFSYYGQNGPYSYIMAMPITRLLILLRLNGLVIEEIFVNNCMQENDKSKRVLDMLVKAAKITNAQTFAKMYIDHALNQHRYWH